MTVDPKAQIKQYQREIAALKKALEEAKQQQAAPPESEEENKVQGRARAKSSAEEAQDRLDALKVTVISSTSTIAEVDIEQPDGGGGKVKKKSMFIRGKSQNLKKSVNNFLLPAQAVARARMSMSEELEDKEEDSFSDDDFIEDEPQTIETMRAKLKKRKQQHTRLTLRLEARLKAKDKKIAELQHKLTEAEATLNEYDQFFVNIQNKNAAIGETLQHLQLGRLAEKHRDIESKQENNKREEEEDEILSELLQGIGLNSASIGLKKTAPRSKLGQPSKGKRISIDADEMFEGQDGLFDLGF